MPASDKKTLTFQQAATALGITLMRVQELIHFGYLKKPAPDIDLVLYPGDSVMEWLRFMHLPLSRRPHLPAKDIASFMDVSLEELMAMCLHYKIQVYHDPAFGYLFTIPDYRKLQKSFHESRVPFRTDRQALLIFHAYLRGISEFKPAPIVYSEKLENEIRRIAKMDGPERIMRATALWMAYRDAESIMDCFKKYEVPLYSQDPKHLHADLIKEMMNRMEMAIRSKKSQWGFYGKLTVEEKKKRAHMRIYNKIKRESHRRKRVETDKVVEERANYLIKQMLKTKDAAEQKQIREFWKKQKKIVAGSWQHIKEKRRAKREAIAAAKKKKASPDSSQNESS